MLSYTVHISRELESELEPMHSDTRCRHPKQCLNFHAKNLSPDLFKEGFLALNQIHVVYTLQTLFRQNTSVIFLKVKMEN